MPVLVAFLDHGHVYRFANRYYEAWFGLDPAEIVGRHAREVLGALPFVSHPGSYFVWLPLGEEGRADRLAKTLMARHISVSTAEPFCVTANVPQALRIALGSVPFDSLRAALNQVREAVEYEQYR